jgi:hypothetical protein
MSFRITFSNSFWERFKETIFNLFFKSSDLRYNFGYGWKDVKEVAKYHLKPEVKEVLQEILDENKLVNKKDEFNTVSKIMHWVNSSYPSGIYYTFDKGDSWNDPVTTLDSFEARKELLEKDANISFYSLKTSAEWLKEARTDCDDYAILIYNLCRVAGVKSDKLYLCWMKTTGEWHMNCMYFYKDVPYALEGTYFPEQAMKNFGRLSYWNTLYYQYVKWIFNEEKVFRYTDRVNPL